MRTYRRLLVLFVTIVTVLAAAPAFAQGQGTGVGIGALGGLTYTTVRTDENQFDIDTKSGNGFMLGIWFGGNRDGRVGLMGEVSYLTKKAEGLNGVEGVVTKNSYVEIPVLLRINAGSRSRAGASLYFLAGPVFDIQINTEEDEVDSPDDVYEGLDIGLMGGVGFEVARIGVEARYSWGLRSVLATDAAELAGFGKAKLNTFQILAKIRFN